MLAKNAVLTQNQKDERKRTEIGNQDFGEIGVGRVE